MAQLREEGAASLDSATVNGKVNDRQLTEVRTYIRKAVIPRPRTRQRHEAAMFLGENIRGAGNSASRQRIQAKMSSLGRPF